jgi:hypothetical protein
MYSRHLIDEHKLFLNSVSKQRMHRRASRQTTDAQLVYFRPWNSKHATSSVLEPHAEGAM